MAVATMSKEDCAFSFQDMAAQPLFIIPVVYGPRRAEYVHEVWFLLERNGTHLISLPAEQESSFLENNDLVPAGPFIRRGPYLFVPIDSEKTDLAAFWSWKEIVPGSFPMKEAWRPFFWADHQAQDPWGVNRFLEEINLAEGPGSYTAYHILEALFQKDGSI